MSVLAYSEEAIGALRDQAQARGDAAASKAVDWERAGSKPMPELPFGRKVGFRVRVCPTVRVGRQHPLLQPGSEVDPYVALTQRAFSDRMGDIQDDMVAQELRRAVLADLPPREAVYRDWLLARIGSAARLSAVRLTSQRDAALWRKGTPKPGPATMMYERPRGNHGPRVVIGRREAVFEGVLEVTDASGFMALLARGIGRHRAFGFGMLLLRAVDAEG